MARVLDTIITKFLFQGDYEGLDQAKTRLDGITRSLDSLSLKLGVVGTASTLMTKEVVSTAASYESSLVHLSSRTGIALDEIKAQYEDAGRSIGAETGVIYERIFDGIQKSISAGVKGQDAIDLALQSAKAHGLGIADIEEAISAATTMVSVFGDEALKADRALDIIVRASQIGEGDAPDFANAFKYSVGIGGMIAKIPVDEIGAALSVASRIEPSAMTSATSLNAFVRAISMPMQSWVNKVPELSEDFKALGYEIETAWDISKMLETDGLVGVIKMLNEVIGKNPEMVFQMTRNVEAQRFYSIMRPEDLAIARDDIKNTQDAIQRSWDDVSGDYRIMLNILRNRINTFKIEVGNAMKPTIAVLTQVVGAFSDFVVAHPILSRTIALVLGLMSSMLVFGLVLQIVSLSLKGYSTTLKIVAWWTKEETIWTRLLILEQIKLTAWRIRSAIATGAQILASKVATKWYVLQTSSMAALNITLALGTIVIKAATVAQWALNKAMLFNPIGLIVALIASLIIGLWLLIKYWDHIKIAILAVWGVLKSFLLPIWVALRDGWNELKPALVDLMNAFLGMFGVAETGSDTMSGFKDVLEKLKPVLSFLGHFIGTILVNTLTILAGLIRLVASLLRLDFRDAWLVIQRTAIKVFRNIVDLLNRIPGIEIDAGLKKLKEIEDELSKSQKEREQEDTKKIQKQREKNADVIKDIQRKGKFSEPVLHEAPGFERYLELYKESENLPKFATGGLVRRRPGGRRVIVGEGGSDEAIIPLRKVPALRRLLEQGRAAAPQINLSVLPGLTAPLPVGPPPALAGAGNGASRTVIVENIDFGGIVINAAEGTDESAVADIVMERLREEFHFAVEAADSHIAR